MAEFRPGGFEDDDDDFDGEGFCLSSGAPDIRPKQKYFDPVLTSTSGLSRGGFGSPQPKPKPTEPVKKYKRSLDVKDDAETKPLNIGDFQMAIVRGNKDRVKQYLEIGFAVDVLLKSGWTGLMYAACNANAEISSLLLESGANPNFQKDMYTVLMAACGCAGYKEDDVLEVVSLLLGKGAQVNSYDRYHTSPLMYAAREGRSRVIESLVKAGANIDKQDSRGYTSLTWAVTKNQKAAARTLMNLKADPRKRHSDGQTVIDMAEGHGSCEMLEILEGKKRDDNRMSAISTEASSTTVGATSQPDTISSTGSGDTAYGTTYGELELFLCGLELSQLVDVVRSQHIDFNTFLRMDEEDLVKIGISQLGVRKKILDGIQCVHKKEWEKSSLPSWQYNRQVSCGEALAIVANTSKHMQYITTTMGFLQDQIRKHPGILEQLQDGTGPKQLVQHTVDNLHNLSALETQLQSMQTQLQQMLKKGNYDPPDILHKPNTRRHRRWLVPLVLVSGFVIGVIVWKRDLVSQSLDKLLQR